ncbi:MAG: hypothetical protein ACKVT0_21585, partial [Planctomycetaceae bacterium]
TTHDVCSLSQSLHSSQGAHHLWVSPIQGGITFGTTGLVLIAIASIVALATSPGVGLQVNQGATELERNLHFGAFIMAAFGMLFSIASFLTQNGPWQGFGGVLIFILCFHREVQAFLYALT